MKTAVHTTQAAVPSTFGVRARSARQLIRGRVARQCQQMKCHGVAGLNEVEGAAMTARRALTIAWLLLTPVAALAAPGDIGDVECFDPEAYLAQNPDVAAAVANGSVSSAERHWEVFGR